MNRITETPLPGPVDEPGAKLRFPWSERPSRTFRVFVSFLAAMLPAAALAQADQILEDARDTMATLLEVGMWILLVGGYIAAAYMIITGAIRLFQDREGGLVRFALGVGVAIAMVVIMTYFVTEGQGLITDIRG